MVVEIKIPDAGESVTEVQIGEWLKAEGEHVEQDEIIVEIDTDKTVLELPAPAAGILTEILKQPGEVTEVGDVIARIDDAADDPVDGNRTKEPAGASDETPGEGKARNTDEGKQDSVKTGRHEVDDPPRVMPAARRLLAEHDLEAADVCATGPGDRLLKQDVLQHLGERDGATSSIGTSGPRDERVTMPAIRRMTADRLVRAQQSMALLTTFNEIDMSAVQQLRRRHGEAFHERHVVKLGLISFFVKAAVDALKLIPLLNAVIEGDEIVYHRRFDIGVAMATEKGLLVPVVRDADRLSFAAVERAIDDLAGRAQQNKLKKDDLKGGTFTITNGGIYGSLLSTPIVNPPQSGVLGMHAIEERPIAISGEVYVRPMMYVALTYDHRIVDGREAVTFLRRIKETVEEPSRLLIDI